MTGSRVQISDSARKAPGNRSVSGSFFVGTRPTLQPRTKQAPITPLAAAAPPSLVRSAPVPSLLTSVPSRSAPPFAPAPPHSGASVLSDPFVFRGLHPLRLSAHSRALRPLRTLSPPPLRPLHSCRIAVPSADPTRSGRPPRPVRPPRFSLPHPSPSTSRHSARPFLPSHRRARRSAPTEVLLPTLRSRCPHPSHVPEPRNRRPAPCRRPLAPSPACPAAPSAGSPPNNAPPG